MMLLTILLISLSIPHPGQGQEFQLLVFGGYHVPHKVEFFRTLDADGCELQPLSYNGADVKPFGAFMEKNLTLCGGGLFYLYQATFQYGELQWLTPTAFKGPLYSTLSTTYDNNYWTFFGGLKDERTFLTWKTGNESFTEHSFGFELGRGACSSRKNQTHAILSKGPQKVYWYEESNQSLKEWDVSKPSKIFHAACATVYHPDHGFQFVISGGLERDQVVLDTTEVFYFDDNKWMEGPKLPTNAVGGAASVPFQNSFIMLGGRNEGGEAFDSILQYDVEDGYIYLDSNLKEPDYYMGAMRVPKGLINCM